MVDANYTVIFAPDSHGVDCSRSIDQVTGETLYFERRKNVYEVDWQVVPYSELAGEKGDLNALGDAEEGEWSALAMRLQKRRTGPSSLVPAAASSVVGNSSDHGLACPTALEGLRGEGKPHCVASAAERT